MEEGTDNESMDVLNQGCLTRKADAAQRYKEYGPR